MNIFIYSDESGVLDKEHNKFFVFGGLMFLSKEERDLWTRKYIAAEKSLYKIEKSVIEANKEIKASNISNKSKGKLYRSLNKAEKFSAVVFQEKLECLISADKKGKQRYLDWAYKMAVKSKFEELVNKKIIDPAEVTNLYFFVDEHTTATNGIYELKESLEHEFKFGSSNYETNTFRPAIFCNLQTVELKYCNSEKNTLIRAADIVANHIYYVAKKNEGKVEEENNLNVFYHPKDKDTM